MKSLTFYFYIFLSLSCFSQEKMIRYSSHAENSPWGITVSEESFGDYPRFNPLLKQAGVNWLRYFPKWNSLQPAHEKWNWQQSDPFVVNCRRNGIQISGVFAYFAKWSSVEGETKVGPIKEKVYWRDYVKGVTERYKNDIGTWEVWNQFNNNSQSYNGTPKIYADMVREAYKAAKAVDPNVKIGINCANFDLNFLDSVIKAGAADHFDFIGIEPFENLELLTKYGTETKYLCMASDLKNMLRENKQRDDIELWITKIGLPVSKPNDSLQAEALIKAYSLSLAQGFKRICWFDARGPDFNDKYDYGIIDKDWTQRPAYIALKTMTNLLSKTPIYLGWIKLDQNGYGFVFQGKNTKVLIAWAPHNSKIHIKFSKPVKMSSIDGKERAIKAFDSLVLGNVPCFFYDLPEDLVTKAKNNKNKNFPWKTDFGKKEEVFCALGAKNIDFGVKQIKTETSKVKNDKTESWRENNFNLGKEGRSMYFKINPEFSSSISGKIQLTVVAKRVKQNKKGQVSLLFESLTGYQTSPHEFNVPEGDKWFTFSWVLENTNFVGGWGWNFRLDSSGSNGEIAIKEVRLKKIQN